MNLAIVARFRYAFLGILILAMCIGAMAQNRGLYLPGSTGLNSGIQPGPGFTYANLFTAYNATRLKDANGGPIPTEGNANIYVDQNLIIYVTKAKIFGAHFGMMADIPFANGQITGPLINDAGLPQLGGKGLADTIFQPIGLGWHFSRVDMQVGWSFFAPTGRYTKGATDNVGSGYWGSDITTAFTFYLTKNKGTQISFNNNWETHSQIRNSPITPGQTDTFEWGIGQILPLKKDESALMQFGAIGYGQYQLTRDKGVPLQVYPGMYYVDAAGGEFGFIAPKKKINLYFRYLGEFDAHRRTEGRTIVAGGAISF